MKGCNKFSGCISAVFIGTLETETNTASIHPENLLHLGEMTLPLPDGLTHRRFPQQQYAETTKQNHKHNTQRNHAGRFHNDTPRLMRIGLRPHRKRSAVWKFLAFGEKRRDLHWLKAGG